MRALINTFLCFVVLASSLVANASSKEDAAHDLLLKSYQQTDIWTQGPMQLSADLTLAQGSKPPVRLNYKVSWATPNKWRAEWSGAGYSRITVVNNGTMYQFSSTSVPPLPVLQYEAGLNALNGHGFNGPVGALPDLTGLKLVVSKGKIGNATVECVRGEHITGELCIDPASAQALSSELEGMTFLYSNYTAIGNASFPTAIRQMSEKQVLIDSQLTVTAPASLADTLFIPPDKSAATDYPACSDVVGTLQGSRLEKKVTPDYPQNAKANNHQGTVWLYAKVGKDGSIRTLQPIFSIWPELQASAMTAVKGWKYSPYLRCGQPVEMETLITVNYSLTRF